MLLVTCTRIVCPWFPGGMSEAVNTEIAGSRRFVEDPVNGNRSLPVGVLLSPMSELAASNTCRSCAVIHLSMICPEFLMWIARRSQRSQRSRTSWKRIRPTIEQFILGQPALGTTHLTKSIFDE
jgi:hypothetical protein